MDTYVAPIGTVIESFVARVKKKHLKNMKIDPSEVEKVVTIPISFLKSTNLKSTHYLMKFNLIR